jgi:hypothetical protein
MNPSTRVSVHCYEGDGHQVRDALELYLHHQRPVTIISPTDSRVVIDGVDCRFAGQREGSIETRVFGNEPEPRVVTAGPVANQRQIEQMKLLLTYPDSFFLMNDADSFCLSPQLPHYLYDRDIIWCNYVEDPLGDNRPGYDGYPPEFPFFAMQPPYFLSRAAMEKLIAVSGSIVPNKIMPWIDHFMLQLAFAAGITVHRFKDSIASDVDRYPENLAPTLDLIRNEGRIFVHSSKSPKTWRPMIEARQEYLTRVEQEHQQAKAKAEAAAAAAAAAATAELQKQMRRAARGKAVSA